METCKQSSKAPESPQSWTYLLDEDIYLDDIDLPALFSSSSVSTSTTKLSFEKFPNEVLVLIFKKCRLSTQQLLQLRTVSSRWMALIDQHVLESHSKRSLKLLVDDDYNVYDDVVIDYCHRIITHNIYDWKNLKLKQVGQDDDLIIPEQYINEQFCNYMSKLFPKVEQLVFHFESPNIGRTLPYLLAQWPNLTTLSLLCHFNKDYSSQLFGAIHKLTSLKHLDLMDCYLSLDALAPTLNRLKYF